MAVLRNNVLSIVWPTLLACAFSWLMNACGLLYSHEAWFSIIYFVCSCFLFNLIYSFNRRKGNFSDLLFAGIIIRLLLALTILLVYGLLRRHDLLHFAAHFVTHYILFTIFEIRFLIWLIKLNAK